MGGVFGGPGDDENEGSPGTLFLLNTYSTGDALVIGLPSSSVTIGLVRLNLGAGLVAVLTGIMGGILGGVTTGSTARR